MIKNEQKQLERLREEIARKLTRTENQKLEMDQECNRLLSKTRSLKNGAWLLNIVSYTGFLCISHCLSLNAALFLRL